MQPNLMSYTLQLSLGPDHIRRHPYISEDVPKFLMISRRVCMEPYLLRCTLHLSLRPPRRILTQTHLLYFTLALVKLLLTQCSLEAFLFPFFGLLQFFSDPLIKIDIETLIKEVLASITRYAAESVLSLIQGIN